MANHLARFFFVPPRDRKRGSPWPKEAWGANYATDRRWKNL